MGMLAFTNTSVTKKEAIKQIKAHIDADELIKGVYWENGKGCAVGCTIHSNDHVEYETRFGIPQMLARLEDCIFEGLPNGKAKAWPLRFMNSIRPGADLSTVGWEFQHRLQINNLKFAQKNKFPEYVIAAIKLVIDVLEPMTKGKKVNESAARSAAASAASAARSAAENAESAAWSAAWSAAASAESAAWSAESAAWSAERSAERSAESAESAARSAAESAESAAWSAAKSAAYEEMADLLIEIIKQH